MEVHGLKDLILLKWILSKLIYRLIVIYFKIPDIFFGGIDKLILKLTWKSQGTRRAKNLEKERCSELIKTLLILKLT